MTAKLFFFIFAYAGIVNRLLHAQILWTGDAWPARFAVIIADVWKTTPFMALLILAGLQVIRDDVYEAAQIDGATKWQQFVQITLPLVKPALMVAILFRTLDVLRIFDLPYILTGGGGGNGDATTTLSILVIQQIRQGFNSAAALSTITFIFIFLVAFIFVRFLGANVVQTQDDQRRRGAEMATATQTTSVPGTRGAHHQPRSTFDWRQSGPTSASPSSSSGASPPPCGWSSRPSVTSDYTFETTPVADARHARQLPHRVRHRARQPPGPGAGQQPAHRRGGDDHRDGVGVFCAYALARLEFRGKYVLLGLILAASMFPPVALVSPLFQLFTNIGWIGQYQALIIPDISFALPLTIYMLMAFFREMPWDLEESARIDGCTRPRRSADHPAAGGAGLFTTAILAFIAAWNEFLLASQLRTTRPRRSRWRSRTSPASSRTRSRTPP